MFIIMVLTLAALLGEDKYWLKEFGKSLNLKAFNETIAGGIPNWTERLPIAMQTQQETLRLKQQSAKLHELIDSVNMQMTKLSQMESRIVDKLDEGQGHMIKQLAAAKGSLETTLKTNAKQYHDNKKVRLWAQYTFSTELDNDILPHKVEYILSRGISPDFFLVQLHHVDANSTLFDESESLLKQKYGIWRIKRFSGDFTSSKNAIARQANRNEHDVGDCDWVVRGDSDEFVTLPAGYDFPNLLEEMGEQGYDGLFGMFNDRVARDGKLINVSSELSLDAQFPLHCNVSKIGGGVQQQAFAYRGYLQENDGGHGLLNSRKQEPSNFHFEKRHCGYPRLFRVDHYKWSHSVVKNLRRRAEVYQKLHRKVLTYEATSILDHIDKHGGIGVNASWCTEAALQSPFFPYNNYSGGESCGNLTKICPTRIAVD